MTHTAVIYCRISDDSEGERLGVERQEADCRARVKREGWSLVAKPFVDNDVGASRHSGKARPKYGDMIELVERGSADVIVAYSNGRLTRRVRELDELLDLHDRTGVEIRTVVSGDDDLSTADGRMVAHLKASIDEAESDRISERVRRAQRQAREAGRRHGGGKRPFGFERIMARGVPTEYRRHPTEADLLAKAIADVLAGTALGSIIRKWNLAGVRTVTGKRWDYSLLRSVLMRASNAELVGAETQRALIAYLSRPGRRTSPTWAPRHLCAGLATCGRCGGTLRSGMVVPRRGQRYSVYRCTGRDAAGRQCGLAIAEWILDAAVRYEVVEAYQFSRADRLPSASADSTAQIVALRGELADIGEAKAQNLRLLRAGAYTEAELIADGRELTERARVAERAIAGLIEANAHAGMVLDSAQALIGTGHATVADREELERRFDALSLERRRTLVRALLTIVVRPGRGADRVDVERRVA